LSGLLPFLVAVFLHQLNEQQLALAVDPTAEFGDVVEIEDEEICAESDKGGDYCMTRALRLNIVLLTLHTDCSKVRLALAFARDGNTMQNESGRKNMLTNVRSLMFSFSLVDALLSITPLALKSYFEY